MAAPGNPGTRASSEHGQGLDVGTPSASGVGVAVGGRARALGGAGAVDELLEEGPDGDASSTGLCLDPGAAVMVESHPDNCGL